MRNAHTKESLQNAAFAAPLFVGAFVANGVGNIGREYDNQLVSLITDIDHR